MNVSTSWLIYILVTLVTYFLLTFIAKNLMNTVKILISLLVGALAVFLSAPNLEIETGTEKLWLGMLLLVSYIAPIGVGLFIIWKGGYFNEVLCVRPESVPRSSKSK
jgi:hypothetical protein